MNYPYLLRRARWLEKRLATTTDENPGRIFDVQEYKELRDAFAHLGVQYTQAPVKPEPPAPPVKIKPRGEVTYIEQREEPPRLEEVYVVPQKPRARGGRFGHGG